MLRIRVKPRSQTDCVTISAWDAAGRPIDIVISNEDKQPFAIGITAPPIVRICRLAVSARQPGQTDEQLLKTLVPLK